PSARRSRMLVSTATRWGFPGLAIDNPQGFVLQAFAFYLSQAIAFLASPFGNSVPVHMLLCVGRRGLLFHRTKFRRVKPQRKHAFTSPYSPTARALESALPIGLRFQSTPRRWVFQ